MSTDVALGNLSVAEKLELMERPWDDLSRRPENVPSPQWHGDVLAERIAAVSDGRTDFVSWDDAKKRLRERLDDGNSTPATRCAQAVRSRVCVGREHHWRQGVIPSLGKIADKLSKSS